MSVTIEQKEQDIIERDRILVFRGMDYSVYSILKREKELYGTADMIRWTLSTLHGLCCDKGDEEIERIINKCQNELRDMIKNSGEKE